tara:strand:+ start:120 stop:929 length:810 start_codon:yes stop_codon:yes gene_type:complete
MSCSYSTTENENTNTKSQKSEKGKLKLYNDGYLYIGEIKNGQPEGRGTLRFSTLVKKDEESLRILNLIKLGEIDLIREKGLVLKYIGDWVNGEKNGDGKIWYSDGTWWEGKFKDDGVCQFCDGDYRFGNVFDGYIKFYTVKNGEVINEKVYKLDKSYIDLLEGNCDGDCDFGYGTLTYFEGGIYKGYFDNSEKNGSGTYENMLGKYVGEFRNNRFHGHGEYFFKNGDHYSGEFKNGLENGNGEKIYKNGRVEKGVFKNGEFVNPVIYNQ